jgi:uncharacterized membrane-anchored protein
MTAEQDGLPKDYTATMDLDAYSEAEKNTEKRMRPLSSGLRLLGWAVLIAGILFSIFDVWEKAGVTWALAGLSAAFAVFVAIRIIERKIRRTIFEKEYKRTRKIYEERVP